MSTKKTFQRHSTSVELPSTRWTSILNATDKDHPESRQKLSRLLEQYRPALIGYLVCARKIDVSQAEDLVQDFITDRILEANLLNKANREKGRFRGFMFICLNNFIRDKWRRQRRHDVMAESIDIHVHEHLLKSNQSAPDLFDVAWVRELLSQAAEATRQECLAEGRNDIWTIFSARVLEPCLNGKKPVPIEVLASQYNLQTPNAVSNYTLTGKRKFVRCLRLIISDYSANPVEIEEEIQYLKKVLSR